jgi:hypothetical protein
MPATLENLVLQDRLVYLEETDIPENRENRLLNGNFTFVGLSKILHRGILLAFET